MSDAKVRTEVRYDIYYGDGELYTVESCDESQGTGIFIDKNGGQLWMDIPIHVWPAISAAAERLIARHKTSTPPLPGDEK